MFKVEEEFGVSVSDEDLKAIKTLADLEKHVAAAGRRRQGLILGECGASPSPERA